MNIYGHIMKAIIELDEHIFSMQEFDDMKVIEGIKDSWNYLQKYMKNIHPEFANYLQETLEKLDLNEVLITKDMVDEAYYSFKGMKEERINVKMFMLSYMWIIERLLIVHKPDESCDVCQGHLHYYFNETEVIKLCSTCTMAFQLNGKVIPPIEIVSGLRPATKSELLNVL